MSVDLQAQTTALLGELLCFNTVNPPGNERPAQEHLAAYLGAAGLECELLGATPERPNLIARLRGERDGPTLCYLAHIDTVLADPREWRHDPWSAELVDGELWGRGALDMKSQGAAEAVAAASLARSGWRPARGELMLISLVDEETGGELGARWITENHPDKVRCDFVLNEGGGKVFEYAGINRYGICCGEKGVFRFTLTTTGVAGHASRPQTGDNALLKLATLLARLGERQPALQAVEEPRALLRALGEDGGEPAAALARIAERAPELAPMLEPMFGITFAPTKARASEKINVIPSRAHLQVDCRVPPGLGEDDVRRAIADVVGPADGRYELSFDERVGGNRSAISSPLWDALAGWLDQRDPGSQAVPVFLPGFSDSRSFRSAFPDCVAYGFFPQRAMTLAQAEPLLHAADERIDVRDLGYAADCYTHVARTLLH